MQKLPAAAGFFLVGVLLCGCGDTIVTPTRESWVSPTTPENVLHDLSVVLAQRDIAGYQRLLAPDFHVHFDWESEADSMTRAEDVARTRDLLLRLTALELRIVTLSSGPDPRSGYPNRVQYAAEMDISLQDALGGGMRYHVPVLLGFSRQGDSTWALSEWYGQPVGDVASPGTYVYRDDEPLLIHMVPPTYPEVARARGVTGKVVVNVFVGVDGRVRADEIAQGAPELVQAALEAVRQYRFKPALAGGHPVGVWVAVPINFLLET